MNEQKDNPGDRIEHLLQRWGAEEAIDQAHPPDMPSLDSREARRPAALHAVMRWGAIATAAMILITAVAVVYLPGSGLDGAPPYAPAGESSPQTVGTPEAAPQSPPGATPPGRAATEAKATVNKELQDLRRRLADAEQRAEKMAGLAGQVRKLQDRIAQMQRDHAKKVGDLEAALADERKARQRDANSLVAAKRRVKELEASERAIEASNARLAASRKEAENLRQRLQAAVGELARIRSAEQEAAQALARARREMQQLKLGHLQVVESFRRTYLASLAPGQSGLSARKTAARSRQMIDRLANLSTTVRNQQTRQLLARLEAVLTRLELMNTDSADSQYSFQRLVAQNDLAGLIDAALSAPGEPEPVRNWLFEAKLILTGGPDAG